MQSNIIEGYQLSPRQKQLWVLQQNEPRLPAVAQGVVLIEGDLDARRLQEALAQVVGRHEILRTTFQCLPELDLPLQVIADDSESLACDFHVVELEHDEQPDARLEALRLQEQARPFDFERGPLLRACLLRLSPVRHYLLLTLPALIADARSLANIFDELAALTAGGQDIDAAPSMLQYADFSEWHNQLLESDDAIAGRDFWQTRQLTTDSTLPLTSSIDAQSSGFTPELLRTHLTAELTAALRWMAEARGASEEEFLLTCWLCLLARHTASTTPLVAVLSDGRPYPELLHAIGLYARLLPVTVATAPATRFNDMLARTADALAQARRWQDYFSRDLLDTPDAVWPHGTAEAARRAWAASFAYERVPRNLTTGVRHWQWHDSQTWSEPSVLALRCVAAADQAGEQRAGNIELRWHYDGARLDAASVSSLGEQYVSLLRAAVAHPDALLTDLDSVGDEQRRRVVEEWNRTDEVLAHSEYAIHELVAEQATRTPDAVAVASGADQLTYRELDARANQLARYLRARGVGAETPVAVMLERSTALVVALLGVLKAGGAYVPLDPTYPHERLRWMMADTGAAVVLTESGLTQYVPPSAAQMTLIDVDWARIAIESAAAPEWKVNSAQLAYIIYTSGSTGKPKGVMVAHRQIVNRLLWMQQRFPLSDSDAVLQKTPFSFDASIWEFFVPLLAGARLVMAQPGGHRDVAYLVREIANKGITVLQVVPSLLWAVVEEDGLARCETLRRVFSGGEALPQDLAERFGERAPWVELINLYGPTEASIDATYHPCSGEPEQRRRATGATVEIGRPLGNVRVYVVDAAMRPTGIGVAGELYIGGSGVARGYFGRAELTAERFVPDPFSGQAGGRLYRTGDVARVRADGEVEFIGRLDNQVKVRGYRIELGEIEAALRTHPAVREAVVLVHDDEGGDKRLVAYVVRGARNESTQPTAIADGSAVDWRGHLSGMLPDYMIPSAFIALDHLPLTPNGKLDRAALPFEQPRAVVSDAHPITPLTPTQEVIAAIWSALLHVEQPHLDDDFFAAGGHSLLATQLISRVAAVFGVEVAVRALFESPSIAGLAARVDEAVRAQHGIEMPPLERRAERAGRAALSFAQQRLWFLDQLEPGSATYNVPMAVRLRGELKVEALAWALTQIVRRHEVLRTTFQAEAGRPVQVIGEARAIEVEVEDLRGGAETANAEEVEAAARRIAQEEAGRAFDLAAGPVFRVRLLRVGAAEHVLVVVLHHIVSDGWSTGVLVREFAALYEAHAGGMVSSEAASDVVSELAEPAVQYADYAEWQRGWMRGEVLERQLGYWREQLAGAPEGMELGVRERPVVARHEGAERRYEVGEEEWRGVRELSVREGVTPFMVLLAAFDVLLWRHTGLSDIVVGTDVANRNRTELEGLIGFFANQLVLRTDLSGDPNFKELLGRVREVCLGAYAHQDLPFEKLVETLQSGRDLSKNPLFQVMFVFQNVPMPALELPSLSLSLFEIGGNVNAKFDLTLFITETKSSVSINWNYNTDLFDAATISRLALRFQHLLASIVAHPDARLLQLDFIPQSEITLAQAEETKRKEAKRNRFIKSTPKAIDLREVSVVQTSQLGSASLPLLLHPRFDHVDLLDWSAAHQPLLNDHLLRHGALLFRGFGIRSADSFERFARSFCPELFAEYGDLPRTSLGGHVYGSTPYPPDQPILFHNESSQMHCWPRKIFFGCTQAARSGGQTPVVDCRRVYQRLEAGLRDKFARLGVMYVRNFTAGLDVSWQEFFRTSERAEVERYCREAGIEWEWRGDGGLQTRRVCQAVVRHPETGELAFFNQIQAHHVSCLAAGVRESVLSLFGERGAPRNVYFGDGSRISDEEMQEVREVYEEEAVDFGWEQGDVLVVENMLVAHGRRAYAGERHVMVTMGDMFSLQD